MIIGYVGTRGRGKTLSCVREAYEHQLKGYTVYANLKLNRRMFPNYVELTGKMITDYVSSEQQFNKAFFILDEVHVYLDSRSGMSKRNVIISYFILQTRKRDVRLGYTTQFIDQVDKRLRQPTEVMVYCQNYNSGKDIKQKNIVFEKETGKRFLDTFSANEYFDYYDTNYIINPFKG